MGIFLFNLCFLIYFTYQFIKMYKNVKKDLDNEKFFIVTCSVGLSLSLFFVLDIFTKVVSSFLNLF